MLRNIVFTSAVVLLAGVFSGAFAQATKASLVSGEITAIGDGKITVNTANGAVEIALNDKTEFKRTPADKPSLTTATAAELTDAAIGDKVVVSGFPSTDGKSVAARTVYLMTKADITRKQNKDAAEWRARGITGKVKSVNQQLGQMTIEVRNMVGSTDVTLTPKGDAKFKRYAQDSIRFDEAKDSSLAEIQTGDMVRALGDRSSDGTAFSAEQVVSGAFQTVAGTIKSVDAEKNEVVIKNLVTDKDTIVVVGDASVVKRYPAEIAERMAAFQMGGGGPRPVGQGGGQRGGGQPAGGQPAGARPGPGGARVMGAPAGGGSVDEMIERFPNIKVADLKVGDMIALSSTKNGSADRIKAIKLLAGVEPFLRMAAGPGGGGRGRGLEGGFSIPGLDGGGADFP